MSVYVYIYIYIYLFICLFIYNLLINLFVYICFRVKDPGVGCLVLAFPGECVKDLGPGTVNRI